MNVRAEIENVHARYAWAFDFDELDSIGDCFTEDAEVLFGNGTIARGRVAVVADLEERRAEFRERQVAPWHQVTNFMLGRQTPVSAEVTCFYTFYTKAADAAPVPGAIGYYADTFVSCEDGAWRIHRRRIVSGGKI